MTTLTSEQRRELERAVLAGRSAVEVGVRAAFSSLGVEERSRPSHLDDERNRLRLGLRAKQRQLGGFDELVWDAAYEQWHRLLFARFLIENGLLRDPEFGAPVTLAECDELAAELGEPDGWSVAARFAAEILPGIFRLEDPCVRLRLAAEHRRALEQIVTGLPVEVFTSDDGLGWVYQYWQSKRKDEVNASEAKIGGADLGPVTQLFTENYMVRFLLENSLGAWWAARHPDSPLVAEWEFLRFDEESGEPAAGRFEQWPEAVAEVTVMDPCCGSGHFLVEAFRMLWRMRAEEEGLDPVAAQDAVLSENLFGLELDPRCVQIAAFAVAMAAWKAGGGWRVLPELNIACSGIPARAPLEEWTALADGDVDLEGALERLHALFKDADTLGSLIDPRRAAELAESSGQMALGAVEFDRVAPLLEQAAAEETDDPAAAVLGADAAGIARAARLLTETHSLVVTNPPYLTRYAQGETLRDASERVAPAAKSELATTIAERFRSSLVGAYVLPQTWSSLGSYESLRRMWLRGNALAVYAKLGTGAFEGISGEVVNVGLLVLGGATVRFEHLCHLDVGHLESVVDKATGLRDGAMGRSSFEAQLANPDARLVFGVDFSGPKLMRFADSLWGLRTADNPRFVRAIWEIPVVGSTWVRFQGSVSESQHFGGRDSYLRWEGGRGSLAEYADLGLASLQGNGAWGKSGVVATLSGDLPVTLYTGERFGNSVAAVWAESEDDLPAIYSFMSSDEFSPLVRLLDSKVIVTNKTLLKVPFDLERWRAVAEERFPDGLPEPWSDDPTQWLFEGDPAVATEPLQVAVGRLVGFCWPEQPEVTPLDGLVDDDGIVCLPAVAGERPAAQRLEELLAAAYAEKWHPGMVKQLLAESGSKKKDLGSWLEKEFFKEHCQLFGQRPFVWHVTDGQKDGFSALVNYHKLDRANLEKLTYTYVGQDWIERQRAGVADGVAGADVRLAAAQELKAKLELILEGEPPYDIYVRWKQLHEQPIGWDPDLDDGVRLNIRPFVEAGVLASGKNVPRVHWRKDRGKNPDGSERHNDLHFTNAEKHDARSKAGAS